METINAYFLIRNFITGGVEATIASLAPELKKRGKINPIVVVHREISNSKFYKTLEASNVNIVNKSLWTKFSGRRPKNFFKRRIWRFLQQIAYFRTWLYCFHNIKKTDLFIEYNPSPKMQPPPFIKGKKILWVHSSFKSFSSRLTKFTNYNYTISLTKVFKDKLSKLYPEHSVHIVPNGLNFHELKTKAAQPIPEKFLHIKKQPYFIAVTRLDTDKDNETLLKAFRLYLEKSESPYNLYIAGDGTERKQVEGLIKNLQLENNVFLLGNVSNPMPLIKNAQALILSSRNEGFGLVLIEAMVLGTLAVSADCPDGPREIMMDGKCGLLFEPGNQEQLADIMENIASGKIDKAEYVKAASKNLERFNIDNTVKVAEETLLKIAAE